MQNRQQLGIVIAALGLLTTCCTCPLTLNSLMALGTRQGLYNQIFSARVGDFLLSAYVIAAQELCLNVLTLAVLVAGISILMQARRTTNSWNPSQVNPQ